MNQLKMLHYLPRVALSLGLVIFLSGCKVTDRMAMKKVEDIARSSFRAFLEEEDLELAGDAVAANVKMIEGLLFEEPDNHLFQILTARAFFSYAYGYVERESPERASRLYLRGLEAGSRSLGGPEVFMKMNVDSFQDKVERELASDLEAWFWSAMDFASWMNLNKDAIPAMQNLPKMEIIGKMLVEVDPEYFYGGGHLLLGLFYASQPRMLGGKPELAKKHFDTCLEINDSRFLFALYLYARYYAVAVQDGELFERLLNQILETDLDVLPEERLVNLLAKDRAKHLLAAREEYFIE